MIRQRLINCDFLNASTFLKLSNKAKLIYLMMITNADDLGFVGNMDQIIKTLVRCDDGYEQAKLMGLQDTLESEYVNAKIELVTQTYILVFTDKHNNEIFVIKHWWKHNKFRKGLRTNYDTFYSRLEIENGEYYLKPLEKETIKESKVKEKKTNESNEEITKEDKTIEEKEDKEWKDLLNEAENSNPLAPSIANASLYDYNDYDEDDEDKAPF